VGYSREDLRRGGVDWLHMALPEYEAADGRAVTELRTTGICKPYEKEYRHKDGHRVPILVGGALFEGSPREGVAFVLDLSERRRAEKRQKLLLDELNHRVKNTLATVQAITAQTLRTAPSPEAFQTAIEDRLLALSQTHDLLTEGSWEGVGLRDLLMKVMAAYGTLDCGRLAMQGPPIWLGPRAVVTLGMAFHELATNAAKYGALSPPSGRVEITWGVLAGDLRIDWQERGGPPVAAPRRRGFGSRLIERGIAQGLSGAAHLAFEGDGIRCTMEIPLDRVSAN
jgi:two-component sensor histidine kinase